MTHAANGKNPLLDWYDRPAYDQISAEHVEPAFAVLLSESENALHDIEEDPPLSWQGLMPRVEILFDRLLRVWGVVNHLNAVRNSPELREAKTAVQPQFVAFYNRFSQSKPIYEALRTMQESPNWPAFDSAQQRIVEGHLREANLAGVGLEGEAKERFNQIAERQAELSMKFSNNVLDATKAYQLLLTQEEEVAGLPGSALALAAQTARQHGHEEATADGGPWMFTLDQPSYLPFLRHSRRRDLREAIYRAFVTRSSSGELDNSPLITEILQLRQEQAELLGFPNFAEMSLDRKMAGSVDAVMTLLHELREAAREPGQKDVQALIDLARSSQAPEADDFKPWDYYYWAERLREKEFDLNDEALRPYFPLPRVLQGMFDLVQRLFDIQVVPADGQAPVWHEDVRYFHVLDQAGEQIAAFYFDPYSRPAEKRGGAWMDVLVQRSNVLAREDQKVRLPIAYMNCNQSPPVDGKPSLMTFDEVTTLFHEFGHALQHMITTIDYGLASGLANVEWDAVEIASQFMENWCYHRPTLREMAHHYETDEPLPDDIIDRLLAARTFQAGYMTLRQLHFGLLDMTLHTSFDPEQDDVLELNRRIAADTLAVPIIDEDRFHCSFSHIFAGGYAAGYYSYKWSEVLSADAFAAFLEAGLDDDQLVQELGRRFRDTILALGGSRHPMEIYKAFRGREPSTEALLRQEGFIN